MAELTRRQVLAAGLAAGAAGGFALAVAATGGAAPRAGAPRRSPPARLAGYTINPRTYGLKDPVAAARLVDGWLGVPAAQTMQKVYVNLPARPTPQMGALAVAGCALLVCVRPSRHRTPAEAARLRLFARGFAGTGARLVLWQEMDDGWFPSQQAWLDYWGFYAPAIQAEGVPCVYDPGCNRRALPRAVAWFPASPVPDELRMDFYGNAWAHGSRLEPVLAEAAARGVPAGLGEWGPSASTMITPAQWEGYCAYLAGLAPRLALGGVYYGSRHHTSCNVVESADDPKIPGIRAVLAALAAGQPPAGRAPNAAKKPVERSCTKR